MLCSRISQICLVSHKAPFRYAFLKRFASFRFSHRQPFRVFSSDVLFPILSQAASSGISSSEVSLHCSAHSALTSFERRSLYTPCHRSSPTLLSCHSCSDTDTVLRLYTRVLISLLFSMQLQSESVRSYQYVYLEAC